MSRKMLMRVFGALICGAACGANSDYWVSPDGTGDGSNAASPCLFRTAIDAVRSDNTGRACTIHMADGTYDKDTGIGGGFSRNGTTVFLGESGDPAKVIWKPHGSGGRITVPQEPPTGANHVTFQNISFEDAHPSEYDGGVIHNQIGDAAKGALTVRNCRFVNCGPSGTQNGGAIKLSYGFIHDSYFENCVSKGYGGAIWQSHNDGSVVSNCTFVSCQGVKGGAVYCNKRMKVLDCTFSGCKASNHAGGFCQESAPGDLVAGCRFLSCTGSIGGAVMSIYKVEYTDCFISNCVSTGWWESGGAFLQNGSEIHDSTITDCHAINSGGGGAGGVKMDRGTLLSNCVIENCSAKAHSGGVSMTSASVVGCTIANNTATSQGGGIYAEGNSVISNCTIVGNVAPNGGGVFYASSDISDPVAGPHLRILDSRIAGNVARISEGGTGAGCGGGVSFNGFTTIDGCTISSNQTYAMSYHYAKSGAGIWCNRGALTPLRLLNSELDGNVGWAWTNEVGSVNVQTRHSGTYGGNFATTGWGPIDGFDNMISNCCIHGGVGEFGGDVYVGSGGIKMLDCRVGRRGVSSPDGYTVRALLFFEGAQGTGLIRNSLFTAEGNSTWKALELFNSFTNGASQLSVENCTIAGGCVIDANSGLAARRLAFTNCAFAATSFSSTGMGSTMDMQFSSCAHQFASPVLSAFPGDGKSFRVLDFRFNKGQRTDREYYEPVLGSPLVDKGVNADWMTGAQALNVDSETGKPCARVLNGRVDIGCYEYSAFRGLRFFLR